LNWILFWIPIKTKLFVVIKTIFSYIKSWCVIWSWTSNFFIKVFSCIKILIKNFNVKFGCLLKELMNVLWLRSMLFIETSIISLFGILAFVVKNCSKWAQNVWMCFVTLSFPLIFNIWSLSLYTFWSLSKLRFK